MEEELEELHVCSNCNKTTDLIVSYCPYHMDIDGIKEECGCCYDCAEKCAEDI